MAGVAFSLSLCAIALGETLGDVLQSHRLPITSTLTASQEKPITSYSVLDNDKVFVIAYYLDDGSGSLKAPLLASRFDKVAREWKSISLSAQDARGCLGSVTSATSSLSGDFFYLDTHINPSAGCLIVLSADLGVRKVLYGWSLAFFNDGSVVYNNNQTHFTPFHVAEMSIYNPVRNIDLKIYPRKPYQGVRREQIRQVRKVFTSDWCRRNNHPCDADLFDNQLLLPVEVSDSASALAFVITFDNARYGLRPDEVEVVYVYRNVNNSGPIEYREMLRSDFKARFGDVTLRECLQPAVLGKIFGH